MALTGGQVAYAQEDDDIYDLSPFTVDASEDTGYTATATLAGTGQRARCDSCRVRVCFSSLRRHAPMGITAIRASQWHEVPVEGS